MVLLIVGGSYDELVEICGDHVKELVQNNKIIPLGKVKYDMVPKFLNICDSLIAPFNTKLDIERKDLYEKFGMWWCPIKIFEYLATGKPIVTSRINVIENILSGFAYYYNEGDMFDLAKAIIASLSEKNSQSLAKKRIMHLKNNYTWEIQAKKILSLVGH
jgi:glycosyltransferase involved in cell wall biosynthesis